MKTKPCDVCGSTPSQKTGSGLGYVCRSHATQWSESERGIGPKANEELSEILIVSGEINELVHDLQVQAKVSSQDLRCLKERVRVLRASLGDFIDLVEQGE